MDEFVSWFWEIEFWHWWAFGIALIALEIFATSTTILLWPAISAFAIGFVLLIDPLFDWRYQMLLFAVLAVATSIGWQVWQRKHPTKTDHPMLNTRGRSYVGRQLTLDEPLVGGRGRVQIDDTWWQVSAEDNAPLEAGLAVEVTGTDGATLIIRAA
ncbi:MAG: NfeD family protein [Alphaproteobacteria bacterium]|jgi:inner membrane protein|nr:NfeD family protein [Alphaproteobacteria bacterium]